MAVHEKRSPRLRICQSGIRRRLSDQTVRLVRDEIRLASAEMSQKATAAGLAAGMFGGAGLFVIYGLGVLVAAAVIALSIVVAPWAAALIVAGALLLSRAWFSAWKEGVREGGAASTHRGHAKHERRPRRIQRGLES